MPMPNQVKMTESSEELSFETSSIITVIVGTSPEEKSFTVHGAIICARSEYFCRAMHSHWTESIDRVVKLEDVEPKTFSLYLNLIYTNRLPIKTCKHIFDNEDSAAQHLRAEYIALAKLYVFAERVQDIKAKNSVVLAMLELNKTKLLRKVYIIPDPAAVKIVYGGTMEGDGMRQLLVDLWTYFTLDQFKEADRLDRCPHEFERDLMFAFVKGDIQTARKSDGSCYLRDDPDDNGSDCTIDGKYTDGDSSDNSSDDDS